MNRQTETEDGETHETDTYADGQTENQCRTLNVNDVSSFIQGLDMYRWRSKFQRHSVNVLVKLTTIDNYRGNAKTCTIATHLPTGKQSIPVLTYKASHVTRKEGSGWKRETESTWLLGYFQGTYDHTRPILFSATNDQLQKRKRQLTMTITATVHKIYAVGMKANSYRVTQPQTQTSTLFPLCSSPLGVGDLGSPFAVICYASNARKPSKYTLNFMLDQVAYMNEQWMDSHGVTEPHLRILDSLKPPARSVLSQKRQHQKAQVLGGW